MKECKHGIPLDWNCNACSDEGGQVNTLVKYAFALFADDDILYFTIRKTAKECWESWEYDSGIARDFAKRKLNYKCKKIKISI